MRTTRIRPRAGRRGATIGLVALVSSLLYVQVATANPAVVAGFEIDGQIRRQSSTADDWSTGPGGAGVLDDSKTRTEICGLTNTNPLLICDDVKSDATTFPGGAKESDPSGWIPLTSGQVTPKTDITNVYALGRTVSGTPFLLNGMERLPKAGDLHLDFEYNREMTGTSPNQIPIRRPGDVLVAYDLGGGRNSNESAISLRIFVAVKADPSCVTSCVGVYDYASPNFTGTGPGTINDSGVTAQLNNGTIDCGVQWQCYDERNQLTTSLPAFSFAEAGIDLSAATGLQSACFNWVTVKSRASESVTSQLKDTTGPRSFPFCGGFDVKKYIDADDSGDVSTGDVTSGAAVSGWSFNVKNASDVTVCTGTTGTDGKLTCSTGSLSDLPAGTYTVTETNRSGYYNTDPGPSPRTTGITRQVTIAIGDAKTVPFGNTCFAAATFSLTGVPADQTGVFAYYVITAGPGTSTTVNKVALSSPSYSATVSDTFTVKNTITWGYGTGLGTASETSKQVATGVSFASNGYPTCAKSVSTAFDVATITGFKFKDANGNGTKDTGETTGLAGFQFELVRNGSVVQTVTSCGGTTACTTGQVTGSFAFTGVSPGSYSVREKTSTNPTGWSWTGSAANVTVALGDTTKNAGNFGNAPESKVKVEFLPQATLPGTSTAATRATSISCVNNASTPASVGSITNNNVLTTNAFSTNVTRITCTIDFVDP